MWRKIDKFIFSALRELKISLCNVYDNCILCEKFGSILSVKPDKPETVDHVYV